MHEQAKRFTKFIGVEQQPKKIYYCTARPKTPYLLQHQAQLAHDKRVMENNNNATTNGNLNFVTFDQNKKLNLDSHETSMSYTHCWSYKGDTLEVVILREDTTSIEYIVDKE